MPSYVWHINPNIDPAITAVIIQFDLLGTVPENDPALFAYDRGFFAGLYDFSELSYQPVISEPCDSENQEECQPYENVGEDEILQYPEFSLNLDRYISRREKTVMITIPYDQFRGAQRELTLQFLPGACFTPPVAYIESDPALSASVLPELMASQPQDFIYDYTTFFKDYWDDTLPIQDFEPERFKHNEFRNRFFDREKWSADFFGLDTLFNEDYSVNLPFSDFQILYGDEKIGPYAIVPEAMPYFLFSFHESEYYKIADFIIENMVDEQGLIKGVWDVQNAALVQTAWQPASLPVVEALGANTDELMQACIDHEIVSINEKWYYAPRGINQDGAMQLSLWDFNVGNGLFGLTNENSGIPQDQRVKLLTAYANSLELLLEAQESTPTNLPPQKFNVFFNSDGSYQISTEGDFFIDNPYVFMHALFYGAYLNKNMSYIGRSMSEGETFMNLIEWIAANPDSPLRTDWYAEAYDLAFDMDTVSRILGVYYKSLYHIYSFARMQDADSAFAPGYDIQTGQPIFLDPLPATAEGSGTRWDHFYQRFGTPRHLVNWFFISGFANDQPMAFTSLEGLAIDMAVFRETVLPGNVDVRPVGFSHLELLERNGFQISTDGGFLSRGFWAHPWPTGGGGHFSFAHAHSFSWREDVDQFMERMLRENGIELEEIDKE